MQFPEFAEELVTLASHDLDVRARLAESGELFDGYNAEMRDVHRRNGDRLTEITDELQSWPGISAVGDEGAQAAFLIAQHDISRPDLMRHNFALLTEAVAVGDADPVGLARMCDRIRVFEGRPQLYGTQLGWNDDGVYGVWPPVEDPDEVDVRRAGVGLPPLADHLARADSAAVSHDRRGAEELAQYRLDEAAFARSVGWRS
jgi:hypothetical protein